MKKLVLVAIWEIRDPVIFPDQLSKYGQNICLNFADNLNIQELKQKAKHARTFLLK